METQFVAGPPVWIDWQEIRWYRNDAGYYQDRTGQLLHRLVFCWHGGRLTAADDVHHVDEDKANNDPSNLERIPHGDHARLHGTAATDPRWVEQRDPTVASERAKAYWRRREPHEVECSGCGVTFTSTGQRAAFCSPACRASTYRRQRREALLAGTDL